VDIIRDTRPQRNRKRIVWTVVGVVAVVAVTLGVRALPTAAPTVDGATVWRDTVRQGTLVRQVRGAGTLVPEQMRWITAVTSGRIEQILLLPGTVVKKGDLIMRLSNPDENLQLLSSQQQLSAAVAALAQLRATLQTSQLTARAAAAQSRSQYLDAQRTYSTNQKLFDENPDLVSRNDLDNSKDKMEAAQTQVQVDQENLGVLQKTAQEQISAQEEQIGRLRQMVTFHQERLNSMEVRVPVSGVLAPLDVPLQEGQWVQEGAQLSRVVVPGRLKAEVRIPQTQAQDILVGQTALIDTRTDTITGRVSRIDPAVQNGTVTIDVKLPDSLPPSARPDLSIDGNVIIERLDNVIYVGRPTFGQANQRVSLFRVEPGGQYADRVQVQLGASSVNEIQIKDGLKPGDVVILSDMSQWDDYDRIRLKG
jgi:HlyD family secretion protein